MCATNVLMTRTQYSSWNWNLACSTQNCSRINMSEYVWEFNHIFFIIASHSRDECLLCNIIVTKAIYISRTLSSHHILINILELLKYLSVISQIDFDISRTMQNAFLADLQSICCSTLYAIWKIEKSTTPQIITLDEAQELLG